MEIVKELREKPVFYIKADKGNKIVIMDKDDYDEQMSQKINNGPYRQLRANPLPDMVKRFEKTVKECKDILENMGHLKNSNPTLPRIKGLPKIHKPGNEMREIISAEGSPTQKLAKWLVKEFQAMPKKFFSRSVKTTQEFASKLQNSGHISGDEIMVSFDVTALFPSVPVKEAMILLEDWLLQQKSNISWKVKVRSYLKLARLCMEENYFTFRGNFYKQTKGAPMGNPLSPFLCELFMANLEEKLDQQGFLPSRWWRYVDDIFSIIKRENLPKMLEIINSIHKNIQFTHEEEKDDKLPFLDILVRRETEQVNFEIYRKPTNTERVIPSTSNHSYQHKMAAFHHMIHRMESLPLSREGKQKEREQIFRIGSVNGYPERSIQAIIDKRSIARYRASLTTLTPATENLKRVSVEYGGSLTHSLKSKLRKFGLDLVFSSRSSQLKTILGSTKDKIENLKCSGIYKISCSHCDKVYIGQTKRTLETRFKEHISEVTKATKVSEKGLTHHFKSKVAEHAFSEQHELSTDDIKILRKVPNSMKLDVAESLEIHKQISSSLLNRDQGNAYSWLFKLLPKRAHNNSRTTL